MLQVFYQRRIEDLSSRLHALESRVNRAETVVDRLEHAPMTAGAAALARAAQLSATRSMAATLRERRRKLAIAIAALSAEMQHQDGENTPI